MMYAGMFADYFATRAHNFTRTRQAFGLIFGGEIAIDESRVVAIGNKTNLLGLRLVSHSEFVAPRGVSCIGLGHLTQRKHRTRKLILRQFPKKIGLIFMRIASTQKPVTVGFRIEFNPRVVAGRNLLATETKGKTIQRCELQTTVAGHAGDWRLTVQITGDERLNYVTLELAFEIENVEGKAEFLRDAPCIVNVVERATPRRQRLAIFVHADAEVLIPQLHRKADQFVALLFQNRGRC